MATLMTDLERNTLADTMAARITHLSLHTATPGVTGASEATGGAPAYIRKAPVFTAAGVVGALGAGTQPATVGVAWSDQVTFDVPAGSYTHWGSWNAEAAGVYRIGNVLAATQTPATQGQILLSVGVGPFSGA